MSALSILAAGMVTAVGLDAPSSCAALRARLDGFCETRFAGPGGDWLIGAPVPLPRNWVGEKRLAHLAAGAIAELFEAVPGAAGQAALILCLPEEERPGRPLRDAAGLAARIGGIVGIPPRTRTQIVAHGRPSGLVALRQAGRMLAEGAADHVVVAGVDSYLTAPAIAYYHGKRRLLTAENANGFLPGEAAAAVLCGRAGAGLRLAGLGLAREKAFLYNGLDAEGLDLPLRGDGMTEAYAQALGAAGVGLAQIDYRIADLIGEQYWFRQTALAALRLERGRSEFQDLWSPAESLGNVGAAVVPLMIGMALCAARKGYAGGDPVLIEASSDDGACGAAVFRAGAG
ncbi:beta-ketoacyl synthase N-terminal-like domain-containing protein [Rhodovulum steppense]|uniref:3-oxoacyl-[acyl-carrier-protein] synthase-1 n=1 Tax=Rhodovulum steppense TaxID=540251 RepID=A0A4R1Z029_9RHOB|nr:beta-ketoacyl synthase N-terminal-like domain-containing protein [Rhodovulum steppense]TCM86473.1 3-oxoacyl-[acyl-carrier-protein] synthase-1 [Rhodovulum steppense]